LSKGEKSPKLQKLAETVGKIKKELKNNQEYQQLDKHALLEEFSKTGEFKLPKELEILFSSGNQDSQQNVEK
jgi:hypothetical protein